MVDGFTIVLEIFSLILQAPAMVPVSTMFSDEERLTQAQDIEILRAKIRDLMKELDAIKVPFFSAPQRMHGGLICIAFCLSVCLFVFHFTKFQISTKNNLSLHLNCNCQVQFHSKVNV